MDTDVASLFWFVVPGFVVPGVLLFLAFRSPSWKQMTRWATQAQVTITTDNKDMILRRLGRARRYRSLLSAPIWWVFALPMITQKPLPDWLEGAFWIPLTAYVLGSMLAAVAKPDEPGGVRTAELSPRLPSRYAPPRPRATPWLLLWAALMLFGLAKAFPAEETWTTGSPGLMFVSAVVVAILAEAALRMIANRPQMIDTPSRQAADDALRSTGATAAVASANMMALGALNSGLGSLSGPGLRGFLLLPALLVMGMIYGLFASIVTQQPWAPAWRRPVGADPGPEPHLPVNA